MEETVRQRVLVIASLGTMALLIFLAAEAYSWFTDLNESRPASAVVETPDPAPRIWPEVVKDLESAKSMTVYSLAPGWAGEGPRTPDGLEIFHQYPILGSAPVKSPQRIRSLAKTLDQGVHFEDWAMCFFPRHGIRAELPDGRRIDLVICYQCGRMDVHGAWETSVHPGQPSKAALDAILRSAGIDLDDPRRNPDFLKVKGSS